MNQTKKTKKHRLNKTKKGGFFRALFKPGTMGVKRTEDELLNDYNRLDCLNVSNKKCEHITNRLTQLDTKDLSDDMSNAMNQVMNKIMKRKFINTLIEYARDGGIRSRDPYNPYGIYSESDIPLEKVTVNNNSDYRYKSGFNWDLTCVQKTLTTRQYNGPGGIRKNKTQFYEKLNNIDRESLAHGNTLLVVLKNNVPIYSSQNNNKEIYKNVGMIDSRISNKSSLDEDKQKRAQVFFDTIENNEKIVNLLSFENMFQEVVSDFLFVNEISPFDITDITSLDDLCNIIRPNNVSVDENQSDDKHNKLLLSDIFIKNGLSVDNFLNSIPVISSNYPKLNEYFLSNLQSTVIDLDLSTVVIQSMFKWTIGDNKDILAILVQTKTGNLKTDTVNFTYNIFWLKNENIKGCSNFYNNFYKYVYNSFNEKLSLNEEESNKLQNLMRKEHRFVTSVGNTVVPETTSNINTNELNTNIQDHPVESDDETTSPNTESAITTDESKTNIPGPPVKSNYENTDVSDAVLFVTHQKRLDRIFNNYGYVKEGTTFESYSEYVRNKLIQLRNPDTNSELDTTKTNIGFRNCVILEINMNANYDRDGYRKVNIVYSGSEKGKDKYAYISNKETDLHPELYIQYTKTSSTYDRLFLCRHGEGLHNTLGMASKIYQSRKVWDGGLTEQGISDAEASGYGLNQYLESEKITQLVVGTSYLRRTMLTFAYMYRKIYVPKVVPKVQIVNNTIYVVPCINEIGSGLENVRSIFRVNNTSQFNEPENLTDLSINWDFFDETKRRWARKDATTGNICPNPLLIAEELRKYATRKYTPDPPNPTFPTTGGTIRNRNTRKRAFSRRKMKSVRGRTRKNKTSKRKRTRRRRIQ